MTEKIKGLATGVNAETVAALVDEVGALYATIETASKLHEEDTKKINNLNDVNMKLFLRVTGDPPKEDPEPEKTGLDWGAILKDEKEVK